MFIPKNTICTLSKNLYPFTSSDSVIKIDEGTKVRVIDRNERHEYSINFLDNYYGIPVIDKVSEEYLKVDMKSIADNIKSLFSEYQDTVEVSDEHYELMCYVSDFLKMFVEVKKSENNLMLASNYFNKRFNC